MLESVELLVEKAQEGRQDFLAAAANVKAKRSAPFERKKGGLSGP